MKKQKEPKKISFLDAYDNLILYLGKRQDEKISPARYIRIDSEDLAAENVIPDFKSHEGNDDKKNRIEYSKYVRNEADSSKLIELAGSASDPTGRLTTKGWHYYRQLLKMGGDTPTAFMAMKFDN